jgi:hypothetical protein
LEFVIDSGNSVISTGMKTYYEVPFNMQLTAVTLLADETGSIVLDIFKCTFAQFDAGTTHPVATDRVTASDQPTISGGVSSQDVTLTGWVTLWNKGDIIGVNVNSCSLIKRVTMSLKATRL